MMPKTGMEVAQYYFVLNYRPPIPQKYLKPQDRTILVRPGIKAASKFILPGHRKYKLDKETPPDALIMDNLETSFSTTVYKTRGKKSGAIVERFIKPIS